MPTTIFTPQMLRNGTRAVPKIQGGDQFTVSRLTTLSQTVTVGPNPSYTTWPLAISSSGTPGVYSSSPSNLGMRDFNIRRLIQSGRGSSTYANGRGYMQLNLYDQVIPGTISGVDLTFRIYNDINNSPGVTDSIAIFSAGTGSQLETGPNATGSYTAYDTVGNKTHYSSFTSINTPGSTQLYTFSLNEEAISVMNNENKADGELINFSVIFQGDYNGIAPTDTMFLHLASGSAADPGTGTPEDYFIPKFDITYIPD